MKPYLVAASLMLMFSTSARAATEILSATFPVPNFSCAGQERSMPIGPAPSTLTVIGVEVVLGVEINSSAGQWDYGGIGTVTPPTIASASTYPNYTYLKNPAGNTMLVGGQLELHPRVFFPSGTGYGLSAGQTAQLIVNCAGGGQMGAAATIYYTVP